MSLRVFVRLQAFVFDKEPMWAVRFNSEGPVWHVRRLTQHEAVAHACAMQWGEGTYKVRKVGKDSFAVEKEHAPNRMRPLGVALCTTA